MFNAGSISVATPCCRTRTQQWRELDEFFPTLKYRVSPRYNQDDIRHNSPAHFWYQAAVIGTALVATGLLLFFLGDFFAERKPKLDIITVNGSVPGLNPQFIPQNPNLPISFTKVVSPKQNFTNNFPQTISPQPKNVMAQADKQNPLPDAAEGRRFPDRMYKTAEPGLYERRRAKEFQTPVFQWTNMAYFGGPDVWYKITQDTPAALYIQWSQGSKSQRYEKKTGLEGNNYTTICGVTDGTLIFIDSPRATPGRRIFVVD